MKLITPNGDLYGATMLASSLDLLAMFADWLSRNFQGDNSQTGASSSDYPGISTNLQAIMNGILGDTLAAVEHPLAIEMMFKVNGQPLKLNRQALRSAFPNLNSRLIVLVHGLCMHDLQWPETISSEFRIESEHDDVLPREGDYALLSQDYNCVYLHYNTGHHISTNGQAFSDLLETLISQWPVPVAELVIIGNSMGGLVTRSACHYGELAGHRWRPLLNKLIFVGVPHHGSHWERLGNWVDIKLSRNRYTAQLANLAKIRSAGITDLRYGYLLDSDWEGRDRFDLRDDNPQPVPLPEGVACYSIAATLGRHEGNLRGRLLGDGVVPINSALGHHARPELSLTFSQANQSIFYRMHHLELLRHPEAFAQIKAWLVSADIYDLNG